MKEETNLATATIIDKTWFPTMELRFLETRGLVEENYSTTKMVLQQLFMNNFGKKEWRDIPLKQFKNK
tara:strand:+ start:804 stop:1007 length:204 start_codon:yes stop_codon:yes gene_type:complete